MDRIPAAAGPDETAGRFRNPDDAVLRRVLAEARTIAIVGASQDPDRPSHHVARSLQAYGYRIVPVNPALDRLFGERAIPDLDHLHDVLRPGERVDVVDVFRAPEHVDAIVDAAIRHGIPTLWLQEGVVNVPAALRAARAGLTVVMDRCLLKTRAAFADL